MDDPRADSPIAEPEDLCGGDTWLYPETALPRGLGGEDDDSSAADGSLRWFYGGTEPPEAPAAAIPKFDRDEKAQRRRRAVQAGVGIG